MSKMNNYVTWLESIANDNSHGYAQDRRGGNPDYDCSSLVGTGLNKIGFNVSKTSTTRTLRKQLLACGFVIIPVSAPRQRGDIFLKEGHHVVTCTDSQHIVHASINENGRATKGKSGDQTGKEICIRTFYNYSGGWDYHFRYIEQSSIPSLKGYKGFSISEGLKQFGYQYSFAYRNVIANQLGIANYKGTAKQNTLLLNMLKSR